MGRVLTTAAQPWGTGWGRGRPSCPQAWWRRKGREEEGAPFREGSPLPNYPILIAPTLQGGYASSLVIRGGNWRLGEAREVST